MLVDILAVTVAALVTAVGVGLIALSLRNPPAEED